MSVDDDDNLISRYLPNAFICFNLIMVCGVILILVTGLTVLVKYLLVIWVVVEVFLGIIVLLVTLRR